MARRRRQTVEPTANADADADADGTAAETSFFPWWLVQRLVCPTHKMSHPAEVATGDQIDA